MCSSILPDFLHFSCAPSGGGYTPSSSWKPILKVAEITVVTTSWRLPDTYIFGVQAGAWYPFAYPEAPLLWRSKDHHWTAVECCTGWLTSLLCHLSLHGSPAQSCRTAHCKSRSHELMFCPHRLISFWACLLRYFAIVLKSYSWLGIRRTSTKLPSSHNIQSHCATVQSTYQCAPEQDNYAPNCWSWIFGVWMCTIGYLCAWRAGNLGGHHLPWRMLKFKHCMVKDDNKGTS